MDFKNQVKAVVNYIKGGEKDEKDFSIGMEMEHFIIDKDTLKAVSYYGENGIESTLKELENMGFEASREDGHILNLEKDGVFVSIEPASQFEISLDSKWDIQELEKKYIEVFKNLAELFDRKNQAIMPLGYHPVSKIDEIKILPKKRYDFMYNYFNDKGKYAHNMMKGTCSLQCSIDYSSEEDFKRKYKIASCLSPVLYTMFDNSYIFEGEPSKSRNMREVIWENTDKDRTGLYPFSFDEDLSYEKYAEHILNTPLIFSYDENGNQVYVGEKTFKEEFKNLDDENLIFHALSIVFPDVRLKRYIEIRMMDEIKYPLNFACVSLIKGLFYDKMNLAKLEDLFKNVDYDACMKAKISAREKGLQAGYMDYKMIDLCKKIVQIAKDGLPANEIGYILPLQDLLEEGISPRDIFEKNYKENGLRQAVLEQEIKLEDFNV